MRVLQYGGYCINTKRKSRRAEATVLAPADARGFKDSDSCCLLTVMFTTLHQVFTSLTFDMNPM